MIDDNGTIISLTDDEGVEWEFEHIATLEIDGTSYVGLVSTEEDEASPDFGQLYILKIITEDSGEEILASIDDQEEFNLVADEFEKFFEENEIEIEDEQE